jgi:hypothetical protein
VSVEKLVIERIVNGESISFELTDDEMNKAYNMVQHHWDKEDVTDWLERFGSDDEINKYTDNEIDRLAEIKRTIESEDGVNWVDAVENAILEYEKERNN